MAKRMLADVLWQAANKYLLPNRKYKRGGPAEYSCWAIYMALQGSFDMPKVFTAHTDDEGEAWRFVRSLAAGRSLRVSAMVWPGEGWDAADDPQGNRYMWLLLAMHAAEDEGITV